MTCFTVNSPREDVFVAIRRRAIRRQATFEIVRRNDHRGDRDQPPTYDQVMGIKPIYLGDSQFFATQRVRCSSYYRRF